MMCGLVETLQQLQASLGHKRLDLLKIDCCEGFEIDMLQSWWQANQQQQTGGDESTTRHILPNQILMELHYYSYPGMLD
jgi:hypothetical protein